MIAYVARAFQDQPRGWIVDTLGLAAVCAMVVSAVFLPGLI